MKENFIKNMSQQKGALGSLPHSYYRQNNDVISFRNANMEISPMSGVTYKEPMHQISKSDDSSA